MNKLLILAVLLGLVACSDGSDRQMPAPVVEPPTTPDPEPVANAVFEVSVVNLTVGQPLSPVAALIHAGDVSIFSVGEAASSGLELLAESGDNSDLLASIDSAVEVSGGAPLGPGATETFSLELPSDDVSGMAVSVVSMLVNTNDAITGVQNQSLAELGVADSIAINSMAYDAGTEANTEAAATIPGPAGGGEGFNAARDDIRDAVSLHAGVVTFADGLASSDLLQQHRFDNPVAGITVTRIQ